MNVSIVHLGRPSATGERRRVASLSSLFAAAGAVVSDLPLLRNHRRHIPRPLDIPRILDSQIVPEALSWHLPGAVSALRAQSPDVAVFVTLRAFHPALAEVARRSVIDYVDSLSISYRDRAELTSGISKSVLLRVLAATHRRAERRPRNAVADCFAAGWSDARGLGCDWLPITVDVGNRTAATEPDTDIGFVGNLAYPPNVEALRNLAAAWPLLTADGRVVTCLVAGATPVLEVRALARSHGWEVVPDFSNQADMYSRLRVAVSPLGHASGMQIKALDAAAFRVPQVVSSVLLRGFAPGFPAEVADNPSELASRIIDLLEDPLRSAKLATDAWRHVGEKYSVSSWVPTADRLLAAG